eukprot:CAMPEP_0184693380 /NCGR_PEP_ID=MMETSP0313-20130426/1620_1 /TAXON_ID=2792 /ORGANISM="Porphyridium aerugineum, Strain SAG 1380-2" /LENGTH=553 /DNA_ID=CAMNT_0027151449 /DNA_START=70 /DNA_END=1731 /DNA_ORIENTATION=+
MEAIKEVQVQFHTELPSSSSSSSSSTSFIDKVDEDILIIGTLAQLQDQATTSPLLAQLTCSAISPELWKSVLDSLDVGDTGAKTTIPYIVPTSTSAPGKLRSMYVSVTPASEKVSRFNSKYSPSSVYSSVNGFKLSASRNAWVVVPVLNESQYVSTVLAILKTLGPARYSEKSKSKGGKESDNAEGGAKKVREVRIVGLLGKDLDVKIAENIKRLNNSVLPHLTKSLLRTMFLVDSPANKINCDQMVEQAQNSMTYLQGLGKSVSIVVKRMKELKAEGFGGLANVGAAAAAAGREPALISLSYTPTGADSQQAGIVFVGKGIVFDTGGLCIKSRENMCTMKCDMAGASAVLGAFEAAVASGYNATPLHCVLCVADNAVGSSALRVDDIIQLYSGKTIEINNTDAEGRLVLGDGIAYAAAHLNPKFILDMATLTGAQGVATGKQHASILTSSESTDSLVTKSGLAVGELVHVLPFCPEFYRSEYTSHIADMKNSVANRSNAQVGCAGTFIILNLPETYQGEFVHVDMAALALNDNNRATAWGVGLCLQILGLLV